MVDTQVPEAVEGVEGADLHFEELKVRKILVREVGLSLEDHDVDVWVLQLRGGLAGRVDQLQDLTLEQIEELGLEEEVAAVAFGLPTEQRELPDGQVRVKELPQEV